tara:strand:+ start:2573 stop:3427 length:855 start_codon:yes stop_codon:yes gene_type:complete
MVTHVRQASGSPTFEGDADSADITPGQLVYWKDADDQYALADASDKTAPAQFIVIAGGSTGRADFDDRIRVTKKAELYDDNAGFTENGPQYLSETAGAYTETRPTTIGSLRQKVGEAITTSRAIFEIGVTKEVEVPIVLQYATSAAVVVDSGNFGAAGSLDAQNEVAYLTAVLPENFLAVVAAGLWVAAEATSGTPTYNVDISGALSDEAWDANTQDTTIDATAMEGSAADDVFQTVITSAFLTAEGLAFSKPGSLIGIKLLQADSGTDITVCFGGTITCEVAA